MSVGVREPRLTTGLIGSVLLHGAVVAAAITLVHPESSPPAPPMFAVRLIAMPAPEAAVNAPPTLPPPSAAPVVRPAPAPAPKKAQPKTVAPAVKSVPAAPPKPASTTTAAPAKTETPPTPPAPVAGATGRGGDVANLVTAGIEFPYPGYINNIANQIIREFAVIHTGGGALHAEVSFTIKRDGSVSPESIRLVTSSGVFSFNQDALAAIEAAGNRRAFGPLPASFQEDILPVRFSFDPATIRR